MSLYTLALSDLTDTEIHLRAMAHQPHHPLPATPRRFLPFLHRTRTSDPDSPPTTSSSTPSPVFSLRRLRMPRRRGMPSDADEHGVPPLPPPPPPKDDLTLAFAHIRISAASHPSPHPVDCTLPRTRRGSPPTPPLPPLPLIPPYKRPPPLDAHEAARRRASLAVRAARDERAARAEELARQARLKEEKEAALRDAAREAEERRARLAEELRWAGAMKAQKEREAEAEAAARAEELAARQRASKLRRMEESVRLRRWREELRAQEVAAAAERAREREEQERERMERARDVQSFSGWVTVQSPTMAWRRRYALSEGSGLKLFATSADTTRALDTLPLHTLQRVRDATDVDELEGVPHALALDLATRTVLLFSDTQEDKDRLLAFLLHFRD